MTTEEYEQTIRPALAGFCGWTGLGYNTDDDPATCEMVGVAPDLIIRCIPDPLHNPADAWALQKALVEWCDERGYDYQMGFGRCTITYTHPCSGLDWIVEPCEGTPEYALVLAAWEVVRQIAERPSGE